MGTLYFPDRFGARIEEFLEGIPWLEVTEARRECFMAEETLEYTYGEGRGVRTYRSVPFAPIVRSILNNLNTAKLPDGTLCRYNVCFLNRYDDHKQHLGWHADDSPGMNHKHPIAVVSFGQEREIWIRERGQTGVIPPEQRQLLGHGSLFIMTEGFQLTHQHRIPKGDRTMTPRVSLTFREYLP